MKGVKQSVALLKKAWKQVFIFEMVYKLLKIIDSGVDNIVTNEPATMKELLSRENNRICSIMDRAA